MRIIILNNLGPMKNMKNTKLSLAIASATAALLVTACGGGGSSSVALQILLVTMQIGHNQLVKLILLTFMWT